MKPVRSLILLLAVTTLAAAAPNVELAVATDHGPSEAGKHDLVVLDDVVPSEWPKGNVLAIHVAPTNWFPGGIGVLEAPPVVGWRNTHPLLRFVSFDAVQVASALLVKKPEWGVALVDAPQSPLVVAGELGRQRVVWVAFDTLESTWPLRVSFPIFIANAVEYLNPATARSDLLNVRPGDAFRLPLAAPVSEAMVTGPDGKARAAAVTPAALEFVWGDTAAQGTYKARIGTNDVTFAASLLDAAESDIRPRETLEIGRFNQVKATARKDANLEHWRWFALGGLAVMLAEWWWFHRRTA